MLSATVITGFLGSGKTTLLNLLLCHANLKNSMVLINEFGEVGIDHLIVSAPAENLRLLANGCMCCQIRGELVDTLNDIYVRRKRKKLPAFDRLLIETTGLADPVPIIQSLVNDKVLARSYRLDSVITVVDALYGVSQLENHVQARKQVAVADVLVLSKTDLAAPGELPELERALERINGAAELLAVCEAGLDPERLFSARLQGRRATPITLRDARHGDAHLDGIHTFAVSFEAPVSSVGLATWLSMLASFKAVGLLRVKGIVNVESRPYVIDVVQSVIHEPVELETWPGSERCSRIVFIVRGIERRTIQGTLRAFALGDSLPATPEFDPAAYGLFCEVAKHFID